MAGYYNPYNFYQNYPSYTPNAYSTAMPMQNQQMPLQSNTKPMEWVEGEVGAKAFQMPVGLPANQPIPLWDSTDTVIYLKSWSPMGFPNPIQKIHYTMPEQQSALPEQQMSSESAQNYVTKEDFDSFRNEMKDILAKLNTNKNQRYKQEENHG